MAEFGGFVTLEDTLVLPVVTRNTSNAPTNASGGVVTYRIYDVDFGSLLASGNLVSTGLTGTGIYYVSKALQGGSGFAAGGVYPIVVSYTVAGSATVLRQTFLVSVI